MSKFMDGDSVLYAMLSAIFSSIVGTLLVLSYLSWGNSGISAHDVLSFIFSYVFIAMISLTGTLVGCLLIGVPLVMMSKRLYPDAAVKGSLFNLCLTLFMWLVVLAWPVTTLFGIPYADVLLLSPYAFCSAAALTYLVYWHRGTGRKSASKNAV